MRRLFVAFVLVVALGGALWLLRQREEEAARIERATARLLAFDDRAVEGIELSVAGSGVWRFERREDGWWLVSPVQDLASDDAINSLLYALRATPVVRVIETPEALAEYGLEPPRVRLRLLGVPVPALDLGDRTPTEDGLFARHPERHGVLVLGDLAGAGAHLLGPFPDRLRERRLLHVAASEVQALEIEGPKQTLRLGRRAEGWWVLEPLRLPASDRAVSLWLETLAAASVVSFDDADGEPPPNGRTRLRLEVPEGTLEFLLAPRADGSFEVHAAHRQPRLVVSLGEDPGTWTLERVGPERLWRANRYAVQAFRYRRGARTIAAAREGERWKVEQGSLAEDEIYTLLAHLFDLPVERWRTGRARGVPEGRFWFRLEEGREGRTVFFSRGEAVRDDVPGIVFELGTAPPELP